MGKEWYLAGRSSKRGVAKGSETETQTPSGCMCAVFQFFDFHPFHFPTTINHQQHPPFKSTTCISEDHTPTIPKGAEAPRNSLESEDGTTTTTTTTVSSFSKEDNFKIPKNIQIKTSGRSVGNLSDFSSDINSSPSTKTPTLVARLMGLDLLPGADSPSFSSSLSTPSIQNNTIPHLHHLRTRQHIQTKHRNSIDSSDIAASTCSLPETPRISSARRSDVDHHHRLSLQIHKENLGEELELPRFSFSKRKCDENNSRSSSPSHYARQIVKQVKESVSRKVGQDITNTLKIKDQAREESLDQFRVKKFSKTSLKTLDESSPGKHSNTSSSCSPRLRFMDTKNKPSTTTATTATPITSKEQNTHPNVAKVKLPQPSASVVNTQPQVPRVLTKPKVYALPEQQKLVPKCKKVTNEKFSSRFKRPPQTSDIIRNKQEETFTRANNDVKITKGKKAQPLSSNLLNNNNINNVPNLLPLKIDPSPPATKIPQKQSQVSDTQESKHCSQLSSCSRQRYKQEGTTTLATQETSTNTQDKLNGPSTTTTTSTTRAAEHHHTPEFQYITQILNRTIPLNTTTTVFFNQWFSPTHPLDPSIFHHLEHHPNDKDRNFTTKNQLGHRWNRRLMFDLVDEVLKEILRPKSSEKRLCFLNGFCYNWSIGELTERVWKRVGDFPCAKCEVLEDIDNLIEAEDMEKMKVVEGEEEKEEGERLVAEIEGKILDTLVHETVMVIMDCCGSRKSGVHVFFKHDGVVL